MQLKFLKIIPVLLSWYDILCYNFQKIHVHILVVKLMSWYQKKTCFWPLYVPSFLNSTSLYPKIITNLDEDNTKDIIWLQTFCGHLKIKSNILKMKCQPSCWNLEIQYRSLTKNEDNNALHQNIFLWLKITLCFFSLIYNQMFKQCDV